MPGLHGKPSKLRVRARGARQRGAETIDGDRSCQRGRMVCYGLAHWGTATVGARENIGDTDCAVGGAFRGSLGKLGRRAGAAPPRGHFCRARRQVSRLPWRLSHSCAQSRYRPSLFTISRLTGIGRNPRVEELNLAQPEFAKAIWTYLDGTVSSDRIVKGQAMLGAFSPAMLAAIEQRFGIQKEILVAIWGIESNYGEEMGSFDMLSARNACV